MSDYWADRGAALVCSGVQLSCYVGIFMFYPSDLAWVVVWSVVAVVTVVCIFLVRVTLAKFVYALTLPPVIAVIWVWLQFLNGTATDFFGLYIFQAGIPLFLFSLAGLVIALAAPEPLD
ncbi:hypothetical protein [Aeromicrobium choanae]|uniref:Uncharacterized protein n=1 Tax=Aeromicrobium choanae TaxID=1736691 RepID=A0A1T4Z0D4_9ACTN|nr:hypothetical protein [Aeromicrobium choanae]SKB07268.1 hypothetical protein SAMN06295964_1620 [Aeromicrobium choanae]